MEQAILDQIMKLSHQMGEMHAELCAKIDANGQRLDSLEQRLDSLEQRQDSLEQKVDAGFKEQAENTARIEKTIKEEAKDTAQIFHDIFRNLGENERKIINLYK